MDRAIAIGKSYCTFQKFVTVLFALCGFSILFWGIKNRNTSNKMSVTTSGTLSNVIVSPFQDKYSMTGTVTFISKGKEVTQSVTGTKSTYQNDQKVTLVYDPKSGIAIIKDEYTSPAEQAKIAIGVALCCIICCLISFLFLSTDLGCSMSVIGGIGRLF
jgi:hypothetical protein